MKYCINFYGEDIALLKTIDEINIELNHIKHLERDLAEFCELHKNQRLNLIVDDYNKAIDKAWIPYIFDFQQEHPEYNIYIRLPKIDKEYYPALKEKYSNMKFYFNIYVKDWDTLHGLINEGVSDIFIVEEMGFQLVDAAAIAHEAKVQIRIFPNVAQSSWGPAPALKKFWIRPEDIHWYEDYIDICEFYGTYKQQSLFYDIYEVDKKWSGNLNNLIIDLKEDINSMCLLPRFGLKRTYCGHKCLKGNNCEMCDVIFELAKNLDENKLRIKIDDKEELADGTWTSEQEHNIQQDIK